MAGEKNQAKKSTTDRIIKIISKLITAALLVAFTGSALAEVTVKAGPRKGRLLEVAGQNAEFFVEKDRTVSVAFYDATMKALPAAAQVVSATAEAKSKNFRIKLDLSVCAGCINSEYACACTCNE